MQRDTGKSLSWRRRDAKRWRCLRVAAVRAGLSRVLLEEGCEMMVALVDVYKIRCMEYYLHSVVRLVMVRVTSGTLDEVK